MVWEACAIYEDGTSVKRLFWYTEEENDADQQYKLEEWLLTRHDGCKWLSVDLVDSGMDGEW